MEASTTYDYSVYVGVRETNSSGPHVWAVQLLADGRVLDETTGVVEIAEHGVMRMVAGQYVSPDLVETGQELEIRLLMTDGGPQLAFDLVRVSKSN